MRILFASGSRLTEYRHRHGWRGLWYLLRRHPRIAYQMAGGAIVGTLSGWRGSHVMVSSGGVVVDYSFGGTRFYPDSQTANYPGLQGWCMVCCKGGADMARFEGRPDVGWGGLIRTTAAYWLLWSTGGRVKRLVDCIDVARICLKDVGVPVPAHIWTPQQLRDHLDAEGHFWIAHRPVAAPADRRANADRGTRSPRAAGEGAGAGDGRRRPPTGVPRRPSGHR